MKKKHKRISISTLILVLFLIVGLSVMLYPVVSDWWNARVQSKAIANYQSAVSQMDTSDIENMLAQAREYNKQLDDLDFPLLDFEKLEGYEDILDITGTGIMAYIQIPQIRVELPIYHGTSEGVLNIAVGHIQGTTLPVGGESTHAVISAHRGLPSATLFSDLDQLALADEFTITVLNQVYTYEVCDIAIVLPEETQSLNIVKGKDLVTLSTCTPYGVNSHRLLVTGKRVANAEAEKDTKILAEAVQIDNLTVVPFVAVPLLIILIAIWIFNSKRNRFPHKNPMKLLNDDKDNPHNKEE